MFKSRAKRLFGGCKQLGQQRRASEQHELQAAAADEPALVATKQEYFDFKTCHRTYSCAHCRAHLADHDQLISKLFQGNHGRAYLFNQVVNVGCRQAVQRELLTGLHAVADIYCDNCETTLGWKYEQAFVASQKYKEGKYIIELVHMLKENNWDLTSYNACELMREAGAVAHLAAMGRADSQQHGSSHSHNHSHNYNYSHNHNHSSPLQLESGRAVIDDRPLDAQSDAGQLAVVELMLAETQLAERASMPEGQRQEETNRHDDDDNQRSSVGDRGTTDRARDNETIIKITKQSPPSTDDKQTNSRPYAEHNSETEIADATSQPAKTHIEMVDSSLARLMVAADTRPPLSCGSSLCSSTRSQSDLLSCSSSASSSSTPPQAE